MSTVKRVFSIRLDPAVIRALSIWSGRVGMTIPEFIRRAIINEAQRLGVYSPDDLLGDKRNTKE